MLAHAASISSSYAVLGGGGVLGLENEGSRQDEVVLIFGGFASIAEKTRGDGSARRPFASSRHGHGVVDGVESSNRFSRRRALFRFFLRDTPRSGPISPRRASRTSTRARRVGRVPLLLDLSPRVRRSPDLAEFRPELEAGAMACG